MRWLKRSGRYQRMIKRIFREEGLPEELMYVAMVESGFNPIARSSAGAIGLWQFRSATAQRYGLRVDRWIDERRDPVKSTRAAALFFKDLLKTFRDWHLAKAGYNAGKARIRRGLSRLKRKDFWTLARTRYIARETRNYVPKILAATIIGKNPKAFGFTSLKYDPPIRYEEVPISKPTELRKIASVAGASLQELRKLNPELLRTKTPPNYPGYRIKVPPRAAKKVAWALGPKVSLLQRHATRGDGLEKVAGASRRIPATRLEVEAFAAAKGIHERKESWIFTKAKASRPVFAETVGLQARVQRTEFEFIPPPKASSSLKEKERVPPLVENRPDAWPLSAQAHRAVNDETSFLLLSAFNSSGHAFAGLVRSVKSNWLPHLREDGPSKSLTGITPRCLSSNIFNVCPPAIRILPARGPMLRPPTKTHPSDL
ncbi:MAG: lytic transglycosylase domain-containing protein [Nitrospinota bacterium]